MDFYITLGVVINGISYFLWSLFTVIVLMRVRSSLREAVAAWKSHESPEGMATNSHGVDLPHPPHPPYHIIDMPDEKLLNAEGLLGTEHLPKDIPTLHNIILSLQLKVRSLSKEVLSVRDSKMDV